ncbi:MAG: Mediator of RNA polymerase II transcription subunit 7 [Tremellales sp. Tagirdzhanova-0007]|nr:MAG: Mediator of RNA polymerase II transcription subunit 7 [Tremellales sp. Tagirdzhanova-0007]
MSQSQAPPDDGNLPITNTLFPPPPSYYKSFTTANLNRHAELTSAKGKERASLDSKLDADEESELAELKAKLVKPRADWMNEDGRWMCFGQMYSTVPSIPTASSLNIPPLIDPAEPPGTSLPPLLHSFLHTLLLLIEALTNTARNPGELKEKGWAHEGDQYIQHLTNLAATMMVSANQLRGVQASSCFTSWGESCRLRLFFTIGGSDVGATHAKTIISASGTDGYSEN